eukprot:7651882-Ditylum_brightwellii.AAC.1
MDGKFRALDKVFMQLGVELNVTSQNEHVPRIERAIRTVKERVRALLTPLPHKKYPKRMIIGAANFVVFWLDLVPPKGGVSSSMSPRATVKGSQPVYTKHYNIPFEVYAQVHDKPDPLTP